MSQAVIETFRINPPSRAAVIGGWVMGGLPALSFIAGGVTDVMKLPFAVKGLADAGYPADAVVPLGVATIVCSVIYLIPQTAVLGAILLTGYMGGAVATHTMGIGPTQHGKVSDPVVMMLPAFVAVALLWGGLLLRDRRLRALLPLRRTSSFSRRPAFTPE